MDWKNHITELTAAGASVSDIASRIGVTPNAIREIIAGRTLEPRGMAAVRLHALKPGRVKRRGLARKSLA